MKVCFKCLVSKPFEEFYKHSKMKDGHLGKCIECTKTDVREHRANSDSVRAYDRKRGSRRSLEHTQKYRAENPEKYKAHTMVNTALRTGKLMKPAACSSCPSEFKLHAHHDDYSRPLEIRWLCARCHAKWHAVHSPF
jgi:hypothetical protein